MMPKWIKEMISKKAEVAAKTIRLNSSSASVSLGDLIFYTVKTPDGYYTAIVKLMFGTNEIELYYDAGYTTEEDAQQVIDEIYGDLELERR